MYVHSFRPGPVVFMAFLSLTFSACSSDLAAVDPDNTPALGGTGGSLVVTGGAKTGTGGAPMGGGMMGGSSPSAGGARTAGTVVSTGGTSSRTGGTQTGGSTVSTGGAWMGGTLTGGTTVSTGGIRTGGTTEATGGARNGGTVVTGNCGSSALKTHPFGCKFAWGAASDTIGSMSNATSLQFVSTWVDSGISASGKFNSCGACNWITSKVASTHLIPVYYAYIIGFLAHSNGIVDGNQSGSKKLTTHGAALVKQYRQAIVDAYAWYAKESYKVWSSKPLIWLLEGDFVQLVDKGQSTPMSYGEMSQLVVDITCAIKSNMPNAVVAIDHSSWNSNEVSMKFWDAMKPAHYDLVWTTGVGNNHGFLNADGKASSYNGTTANYSWLRNYTGKFILVDTSAGASASGDTWSTLSASDLSARISEGVIAANITGSSPSTSGLNSLSSAGALPSCP